MSEAQSIFARYYAEEPFVDRFARSPEGAVDVIIPVLHSNELWKKNLISIYREVPVRRLLLGDAGCKDDTLVIARQFPRVEVYDHTSYKSLGYSVRALMTAVETEWFLYLHSDVYLPEKWFDTMRAHQSEFDWFGCPMLMTVLLEYPQHRVRPYAGAQMGRKAAFVGGLDRIDDDYVYRQEDWVFARIVEDGGFRHGKVEDTFHWHQMMSRLYGDDRRVRTFSQVKIEFDMTKEEELYTLETQLRGTIKYLLPDANQVGSVRENLWLLRKAGAINLWEFYGWVMRTNPQWLRFLPLAPKAPSKTSEESERGVSLVAAAVAFCLAVLGLILRRAVRLIDRMLRWLLRPSAGVPGAPGTEMGRIGKTVAAVGRADERIRVELVDRCRTMARAFERLAASLEN
jgi:hypothetical protein